MKNILMICVALSLPMTAVADDDEHEGFFGSFSKKAIEKNALYETDCGSCHFAFQAGLLPSASWQKLMQPKALQNHFGDNAEVDTEDRVKILNYLEANAADHGRRLMRFRSGEAPLRITELAYFKREHRELPSRMVKGNPQVKSFSNCLACHTGAKQGDYDEHGVRIPGYGYWED